MTDQPKEAKKKRGRPFAAGNSGRPVGSKNLTTRSVEALLDGEAEALTRKVIELALDGDMQALKLCLDRIAPPSKGRRVKLALPSIENADDVVNAQAEVIAAVGRGEVTPDEAMTISALIEAKRKALEYYIFEFRFNTVLATIEDTVNSTDEGKKIWASFGKDGAIL